MPQLFNALFSSLKVAVLLSSVILLMIGLFNPAKATTSAVADCTTQIQQISVAKAKDEQHRPTQGWTTLKKLPDQWGNRWPDFHGIAWYKIQLSMF